MPAFFSRSVAPTFHLRTGPNYYDSGYVIANFPDV